MLRLLFLRNNIFQSLVTVTTLPGVQLSRHTQFLRWLTQLSGLKDLPLDSNPDALIHHIRWSQEARLYLEFLKTDLQQTQETPRWISSILKLGRYSIASKSLVRLAAEFPALFNPMTVESIVYHRNTSLALAVHKSPRWSFISFGLTILSSKR